MSVVSSEKLYGIYRGTVKKHLDQGKCKVWIPGIYPQSFKSSPDKLPDAEQASVIFAGSANGYGVFSYPNIGATVWCMFENGDQNRPVYIATTLGGPAANKQFGETMPMPGKENDAYINKINLPNVEIVINAEGDVDITTKGEDLSNLHIDSDGVVSITTSNFVIDATTVDITASESMSITTPVFLNTNSVLNSVDAKMILSDVTAHENGMIMSTSSTETKTQD